MGSKGLLAFTFLHFEVKPTLLQLAVNSLVEAIEFGRAVRNALLSSVQDRAASGATVIISSHLLAMIDDVVTHLLVMQEGQLHYFGAAADLRAQYPAAKTLEEAYFAATTSGAAFKEQTQPGQHTVEQTVLDQVSDIAAIPSAIDSPACASLPWGDSLHEAAL